MPLIMASTKPGSSTNVPFMSRRSNHAPGRSRAAAATYVRPLRSGSFGPMTVPSSRVPAHMRPQGLHEAEIRHGPTGRQRVSQDRQDKPGMPSRAVKGNTVDRVLDRRIREARLDHGNLCTRRHVGHQCHAWRKSLVLKLAKQGGDPRMRRRAGSRDSMSGIQFPPESPARPALQPVDGLRHAERRVAVNERVNMVRHHVEFNNVACHLHEPHSSAVLLLHHQLLASIHFASNSRLL